MPINPTTVVGLARRRWRSRGGERDLSPARNWAGLSLQLLWCWLDGPYLRTGLALGPPGCFSPGRDPVRFPRVFRT